MCDSLVKSVFELVKLSPRQQAVVRLFAVFLFASVVLGGEKLREALGVAEFAEDHRAALGMGLLAALASELAVMAEAVLDWLAGMCRDRKERLRVAKRLRSLAEDEKDVLRRYVECETRSQTLRLQDGVVQGLVADGIIWLASELGQFQTGFAYNIGEVAWQQINEDESLLECRRRGGRGRGTDAHGADGADDVHDE